MQRRKTLRTIVVYGAAALGIVEGTDIILGVFESPPSWILPSLILAFVIGFPIIVVLSWIFDITPPGLERTDALPPSPVLAPHPVEPVLEPSEETEVPPVPSKPSLAVEMGSAQRRQVTVLSCSFSSAADEDPEALLAILPEIDRLVERVADRFKARRITASSTSFELVFGFPTTHENDAARAVAAGFALVDEARGLELSGEGRLSATVGVYSDLAVVQADSSGRINVVGRAAQVAAWLQTLAPLDAVTLDETTLRLLRDRFECEALGEYTHPQIGLSTTLYRAQTLVEHSVPEDDAELIGRDSEIALVMERWDRALDGEAQFVVLRGEPGIGKSRLTREVVRRATELDAPQVTRMYCSPFESSKPFHPIIEYLTRPESPSERERSDTDGLTRMERLLDASGLDVSRAESLMSTLLSFESEAASGESSESARQEMVKGLLDVIIAYAKRSPLLLVVEDLHWADPSTLEILGLLVSQGSGVSMLCLFTTRPNMKFDWETRSNITTLVIPRMSRRKTESLVDHILGETDLPSELVERIVRETDGNPLFAEELTKAVVESVGRDSGGSVTSLVVPETLHQSLASRMDNLGSAKALLQLCSLLGREFSYELLKAVSQTENESALQEELKKIVDAEFLSQNGAIPDSTYTFKHMLMQETAYQSLLRKTRTTLHAHVAEVLQEQFPETVERAPELIAFHFEESDQLGKAVLFWASACRRALRSYALLEAIELAQSGLRALDPIPASVERDRAEIALTSLLGKGLLTTRGYADPEVEETFSRALALCETIGEEPQHFQMVCGLWMYFEIGGEAEQALFLAERLVQMSEAEDSPAKTLQAHYCCGYTLYRLGRYAESRDKLERAMREEEAEADFTSESPSGDDTRIHIRCALAHVYWHLGDPRHAEDLAEQARSLAAQLGNPYGILWATFQTAWLFQLLDQPEAALHYSTQSLEMAEAKAFGFFKPISAFVQSWARGQAGHALEGAEAVARIEAMSAATDAHRKAGARLGVTQMILAIVEDMIGVGQINEAEIRLDEVRLEVATVGERFFEPEVQRMEGLIAQAGNDLERAEACFLTALQSSRHTGTVSLALRATRSLAALLEKNGDAERAKKLLADAAQGTP